MSTLATPPSRAQVRAPTQMAKNNCWLSRLDVLKLTILERAVSTRVFISLWKSSWRLPGTTFPALKNFSWKKLSPEFLDSVTATWRVYQEGLRKWYANVVRQILILFQAKTTFATVRLDYDLDILSFWFNASYLCESMGCLGVAFRWLFQEMLHYARA